MTVMRLSNIERFNVQTDDSAIIEELTKLLDQIDLDTLKTKVSKEKTKTGKLLYSPIALNERIATLLIQEGWTSEYKCPNILSADRSLLEKFATSPLSGKKELAENSHSYEAIDFNKLFTVNGKEVMTALEIQLGKYVFMTRDNLYKSALFHKYGLSNLFISLVPMKRVADEMSSGVGCYEKALTEVVSADVSNPIILMGVE
jgi:Restriction endonuclease BglII